MVIQFVTHIRFLKKYLAEPNHHGPLKLLNCHGLDGKSWFKKQGPLWALGRDYKVVSTFFCTVL